LVSPWRGILAVWGRFVESGRAAPQFPLGHPLVALVIPGAISAAPPKQIADAIRRPIPGDFWSELKQGDCRGATRQFPLPRSDGPVEDRGGRRPTLISFKFWGRALVRVGIDCLAFFQRRGYRASGARE